MVMTQMKMLMVRWSGRRVSQYEEVLSQQGCVGQDGWLALTAGGDTKTSPHTPDLLLPAWVEHMKINYIS